MRKYISNYLFLLMVSGFVTLATFFILKILLKNYGRESFEAYMLILRYAGVLVPVILMGVGVSIPRYIGKYKGSNSDIGVVIYTGLITISISSIVFFLISLVFEDYLVKNLLNGSDYFILSIFLYISLSFYGFVYSIFRGVEQYLYAGILEVIIKIIIPIAILYFVFDIRCYLLLFSLAHILIPCFILAYLTIRSKFGLLITRKYNQDIFLFGARRVVGDIAYPLLFIIPVFFSSRFMNTAEAAMISFNLMIFNGVLMLSTPVSVMILPKVSTAFSQDKEGKKRLGQFIKSAMLFSIILTIVYFLIPNFIWQLYGYEKEFNYFSSMVAVFFASLFILLRSVIDGLYKKAYLLKYTVFAIAIELISVGVISILDLERFIMISFVIAFVVLTALTQRNLYLHLNSIN